MITFNGQRADNLAIHRVAERHQATGANADLMEVEYEVNCALRGDTEDDIRAAARGLFDLLRSAKEALLVIEDSEGAEMVRCYAQPAAGALPDAERMAQAPFTLSFTSWAQTGGSSVASITVAPKGAATAAIALGGVTEFSERLETRRIDSRTGAREKSTGTVSFTARPVLMPPRMAAAQRQAWLSNQREKLKALFAQREVTLTYGGKAIDCKPVSSQVAIDDRLRWIQVQFQGEYQVYPGSSAIGFNIEVRQREACREGETALSVSGEIDAPSRDEAVAKANELIGRYTQGARIENKEFSDRYLHGDGSASDEWIGLRFSADYTLKQSGFAGYTLAVAESERAAERTVTYSGTVKADTEERAKAKAEELGGGKAGRLVAREIEAQYRSPCSGAASQDPEMTEVRFRFEYADAGEAVRAEVSCERQQPMAGAYSLRVSGRVQARDSVQAEAFARSLIEPGRCLIDFSSTEEKAWAENVGSHRGFSFSFTQWQPRSNAGIRASDETQVDYSTLSARRIISGQVWAGSKEEAQAAIASLVDGIERTAGTRLAAKSFGEEFIGTHTAAGGLERCPAEYSFSRTYDVPLEDSPGFDIISAEWSLSRTGSVNASAIKLIPFNRPRGQRNVGHTPGRLEASGQCTARTMAAAREWGQSKRAYAATAGTEVGHPDPPSERGQWVMRERSGDEIQHYLFSFSYAFAYTGSALDGLWGEEMDVA